MECTQPESAGAVSLRTRSASRSEELGRGGTGSEISETSYCHPAGANPVLRLIGKWIKVGVIEDGRLLVSETGTGQGQPISPLLANIFLHYILDEWFENEGKPRLKGEAYEIRFADDAILCFQHKEDAEKVLGVLPKRFEKYGLTLHPEKTRLIEFGR
jgi:retron-type reverse transcriptase